MNAPAIDIKAMLVADTIGSATPTAEWSIHVSQEPTSPANVITVYDTGAWQASDPRNLLDFPSVQVRVRAKGYTTAYAKALAIRDALQSRPAETVGGTRYSGVWLNGDILAIGQDENERTLLTINFNLMREPSAGTHRG